MTPWHLISVVACFTIITNARLIEKNTDKPLDTQSTESPTPVRVSRQAFYEDGIGISKEDLTQEEDSRIYVRRGRYSIRSKKNTKTTTVPKDSSEKTAPKKLPQTVETKPTTVLVKKPIPKFNEIDYEDFQGKVNRSPVKFSDSSEHEDEDFNLDDYEFDVNHDEFVGRGKPLEPRTKAKAPKTAKVKKSPRSNPTMPPEIKIQSKVIIPTEPPINPSKLNKKIANKMKEDYYDDVFTTTKAPEELKRTDDESSEETDDSKEDGHKRVARSPWLVEFIGESSMGEKTASVISKMLNAMPDLTRSLPLHQSMHFNVEDDGTLTDNSPVLDQMTDTAFVF